MADIVTSRVRSAIMSKVRNKDTKPEVLIRSNLHRKGYRYTLHISRLPGRPDLFLRKYNVAIFINGCFWHKHSCHLFKWPSTRVDFWYNKLVRNFNRDQENVEQLGSMNVRVLIVWECSLKGKTSQGTDYVVSEVERFINGSEKFYEIIGTKKND